MSPPFYVDLRAPRPQTSRHLGSLADALLAGRCDRALVSFGANASLPEVPTAFMTWLKRNDRLVRTRMNAFAFVVPSLWRRLQWQLFLVLSEPVVPTTVHGTEENARRWLDEVRA